MSLLQIVLTGIVYAYAIAMLYGETPLYIWIPLSVVLIFCPFLDLYAVTLLKDVPFSLLLLVWMLFLYKFWKTEGENLKDRKVVIFLCILLVLSLIRNNGVYVSAFMIFGMLVMAPKQWKRCVLLAAVLVCVAVGSKAYESENNVTHLFKETVGIPLQQMAGVIYYGGEVTEEQEEFINSVISTEYILENYSPYSADKLKWGGAPLDNSFLNSHKVEFLKTWAEMLLPNLDIYIDVYLRNTYGFWSLSNKDSTTRYTTLYVSSFDEWFTEEDVSIKTVLPESIQTSLESFLTAVSRPCGAGTAYWIFILLLSALCLRYGGKAFVVALPVIGNWLTIMISTPVAYQWRYTLIVAMAIPLIAGMLFEKGCSIE